MLYISLDNNSLFIILQFVGNFDELTILRNVSKYFKKHITYKCITGLRLNSFYASMYDRNLIWKCADNLYYLDCSSMVYNGFLPSFPNLRIMICRSNNLETLPNMPNIKELDCSNNKLTNIREYPMLEILRCCDNNLIDLPDIKNLRELYCSSNNLIILPSLSNIEILDCNNNFLIALPPMPKARRVDYRGNNVEENPIVPLKCNLIRFPQRFPFDITPQQIDEWNMAIEDARYAHERRYLARFWHDSRESGYDSWRDL
jgi:Leucine-rich repeat (LRR) protein